MACFRGRKGGGITEKLRVFDKKNHQEIILKLMEYSMGAVLVVRYEGMEIYFELVLLIHILDLNNGVEYV